MDPFTTNVMTGVVNSLQTPPSFLSDTFFPIVQTEASEEIHFDVEDDVMGLAPFVSPVVEGLVMSNLGFTTKTFKPAYVKPKNAWEPNRALKRYKGEPIGGNLSPADRMRLLIADNLTWHRKHIERRLEWMAAQILQNGSVTISGEKYPTVAVSFGRDSALSITLAGGSKWTDSGINPLNDLQTWAELSLQKSGSPIFNIVMDVASWKVFRAHAEVKSRLDIQRSIGGLPTLAQKALNEIGGVLMGMIDGFNIWVYHGNYKDDSGTLQPMLTSGTVLGVGDMQGVKAFGAIQDEAAGIQAIPFFSKSWIEEDPSRRFVMTQSAPLLVPYRPNASFRAIVL